jgi:hypothetical protein
MMIRSTDRFLTTHTGSLPRPDDLIRMMYAKEEGVPIEREALAARVRAAVSEVVRKQADAGIDLVNDGEMSKPSYATYVKDRLAGFGGTGNTFVYQDLAQFPNLAKRVFGDPGRSRRKTPACNAPVHVRDPEAATTDIGNLKAALAEMRRTEAFMSAASPGVVSLLPQRLLPEPGGVSVRDCRGHAPGIRGGRECWHRAADRLPRSRHGSPHPVRRAQPCGLPQTRGDALAGAQPRARQYRA